MIKDIYKQEINEILSLFKTKNFLNAKIKIENLIKTYPNDMFLENMYGVFLLNCNNLKDAILVFNKLIKKYPNNAVAYYNLGLCYEKEKRYDEAREHLLFAIDLKSDYFEAFNVLGIVHAKTFKKDYAIKCLEKAFEINPNYIPTIKNLARVYNLNSNPGKAIKIIENKIKIINDLPFAYEILGRSYCYLREHKKGLDFFEKSIELKFDSKFCISYLFFSSYFKDFERKKYFDLALKLRHYLLNKNINLKFDYKAKEKIDENPLKIGFVANCFREHAITYQILGVLSYLYNEKEVKLYAYNNNYYSDLFTDKLKKNFHFWRDIYTYNNQDALRLIREDNLDILIDLEGHSGGTRHELFINRAAPIQITWCGFLDSVGFPEMDYMIADPYVITKEQEKNYSEKIIYMPHSYQVNDRSRVISDRVFTKQEVGLPEQGFVFACFNSNYKITPDVFDVWVRILKSVEGSVLWLFEENKTAAANLRKEAQKRGLAPERLVFAPKMELSEHLARHKLADLFIDTLPCNAHTTASDALWAGLPVLTCMGESFASRVAASLLNAIEMPELITSSLKEYEELAIALGNDNQRVLALKHKLENNRLTTPLYDSSLFTMNIENLYDQMHQRYRPQVGLDVLAQSLTIT
jgi:predicted O-linked N-acetylglucosamine transferase (SPINDLY family)